MLFLKIFANLSGPQLITMSDNLSALALLCC